MEPSDSYPEEGDLVVCTVKSVRNFGAFVELDEFPGKEGFIHVAEIATGWVKRMSDYVREGQRIVCKVLKVEASKGHIDLSLKKVNAHQKREKIQEWKNDQRASKLVEIVSTRLGMGVDEFREKHGERLEEEFGGEYEAFEAAARDEGLPKKFKGDWVGVFVQVAKENVTVSTAKVDGTIELTCPGGNGIEKIIAALKEAESMSDDEAEISIQYIGAPRYRIVATGTDFKVVEDRMRAAAEKAIEFLKKGGGAGKFERGA
jgi:translation initiation factor 2 subunit 1